VDGCRVHVVHNRHVINLVDLPQHIPPQEGTSFTPFCSLNIIEHTMLANVKKVWLVIYKYTDFSWVWSIFLGPQDFGLMTFSSAQYFKWSIWKLYYTRVTYKINVFYLSKLKNRYYWVQSKRRRLWFSMKTCSCYSTKTRINSVILILKLNLTS